MATQRTVTRQVQKVLEFQHFLVKILREISHETFQGTSIPERIDYLMYASAPDVKMTAVNFALPFHMGRDKEGAPMSISDHEGLYGEYLVETRR